MKLKIFFGAVLCTIATALYAQNEVDSEAAIANALIVITPPVRTDAQGAESAVLQNISPQPITAYSVRWIIGGAYSPSGSQDFFPSIGLEEFVKAAAAKGLAQEQQRVGLDSLPPGGTVTARAATAYPDQEAQATVTAVIFADCTAVGDEAEIQRIFAKRKVQAKTLQRLLDESSRLNRSNTGEFFAGLAKIPHPTGKATDPDSDFVQQLAEVQNRPGLPEQLRISPGSFLEMLQVRTAAAVAHSTKCTSACADRQTYGAGAKR